MTEVQGDHIIKCADDKIQNEVQSDTNLNVKYNEQLDELTMGAKEKLESSPLQTLQEVMDVEQGAGVLQGGHSDHNVKNAIGEISNGDNCYHCSRIRRKVKGMQIDRMKIVQCDQQVGECFDEVNSQFPDDLGENSQRTG